MAQKITPNLWFDGSAEEAVQFYLSVFGGGKIIDVQHYPESAEKGLADFQTDMAGKILSIEFEIMGQNFVAINGGPEFTFSEAVSFDVRCKDQDEIDYYWSKLSAVPEAEQCGWCKDKFGLSWQIVPENINELMQQPGAFKIMMQQKKIVISEY